MKVVQLVRIQKGEKLVQTYNWMAMFAGNLNKLKNVKDSQHFRFNTTTAGVLHTMAALNATEESTSEPELGAITSTLPPLVPSSSLSQGGQKYLFDAIQGYCPKDTRIEYAQSPHLPLLPPPLCVPPQLLQSAAFFLFICLPSGAFCFKPATSQEGLPVQQTQRARPYRKIL